MEIYIIREFRKNFELDCIIFTVIFAIIEFIIIIFALFDLNSKNGKINLLKFKIAVFIIDIVLRMLYLNKYYFENNKLKAQDIKIKKDKNEMSKKQKYIGFKKKKQKKERNYFNSKNIHQQNGFKKKYR